jgi:hypothetical protein
MGMAGLSLLPRHGWASAGEFEEALLSVLSDRQTAATLGAAWLKKNRTRRSDILSELQERLRRQGWTGSVESLRAAMASTAEDDFRTGAIVSIDGWWLARTQAELCAVAYFAAVGDL